MKKAAPAYPKELLLQNDGGKSCRFIGIYFKCSLCIPLFDIRILYILKHRNLVITRID
jgi:hypothetical protein